jgi:acetyltransferase-like isoleucine patch superfamily enzyme
MPASAARTGKVHPQITDPGTSALRRYQRIVVGSYDLWTTVKFEIISGLGILLPGALGLWVRKHLYPSIFKRMGRGTVIGAQVIVRHPGKIELGDNVVVADGCTLDARGDENEGIRIGDGTIVGERAMLRCKNGTISIGAGVGIGSYASLFAAPASHLRIGDNAMIGPYVYLYGTAYHRDRLDVPLNEQGLDLKGGVSIGEGTFIGAHTSVMDGVSIGKGCIIGAGAVVQESIADFTIATPHQRLVQMSRRQNTQGAAARSDTIHGAPVTETK